MKLLALATALLGAVALACAPPDDGRTKVVLWHSYADAERATFEELAARFNAEQGEITLQLVPVPHDAFSDKITASIPNGNGPDLFVYAHDRIGDWSSAEILESIEFFVDESVADRFDRAALDALAYEKRLYGLPLAVKSLALFYRKDLVAAPPATTDELLEVGRKLTDRRAGRFGLAYENTKLYGHAPWLFGFGGTIFDESGAAAIDTPGARAALVFARELAAAMVPEEASGTLNGSLFNEGRAAMMISGPWAIGGIGKDVPWAVAPLPVISATGRPAAPFLGAEGLLMSARAKDKRAAFRVMDWMTRDASAIARATRARQVVPNRAAYADPAVGGDAVLSAFRRQAEVAVPMPSTPGMRAVWTPYDTAIQKTLSQGADPGAALAGAVSEIGEYVPGGGK